MGHQDLTGYFAIMAASAVLVLFSFIAVSIKEKSWINWYTLPAAGALTANYILPVIFMWDFGIQASYFAFSYCYITYACVSMGTAAGYLWLRPLRLKRGPQTFLGRINIFP